MRLLVGQVPKGRVFQGVHKVEWHRTLKNRNRYGGSVEWNRRVMRALNDLAS